MYILRKITCLTLIAAGIISASAQESIPADPQIVVGKLENGMTYYVRHNSNPKGCADFYIAHNVGALQEEDNQNGLAHFLEHMAFNGTKHYPDKTLFDFLSKEGVRFGYNINAYTSKYETVYNLSDIPLVRESFVDSVMLVLHDWSCDISCEQDALDAERGVISEEWRRSDNQRSRMASAQTALIYDGGKHTKRSVLGTMDIINGFKRQEILDFYEKWYRPDLQAIIAVGDFDVQKMEERIKRMFSDIPAVENPAAKETYPVPALNEPLFKNMLDPEIKFNALKIIHRLPYPGPEERALDTFWKQHYLKQVVTSIVASRLQKAAKRPDSPVSSAVLVTNSLVADYYISQYTLSGKTDKVYEDMLRFYCREVKRVVDHKFTEDEFNVAKFGTGKRNKLHTEVYDSDITNEMIVNVCKEHFLRSRALSSLIDVHEVQKNALDAITYEEALAYLPEMLQDCEKIFSYNTGTDKESILPSAERMKEIIAEVANETLEPDFISYKKVNLDIDTPAGSIVKTKKLKGIEGEMWTLSNGATAYWLPCEKVKSATHLALDVRFNTGYRTWPQDKIAQSKAAASYISRNLGFAENTVTDISNSPECGGIRTSLNFEKDFVTMSLNTGDDDVENGFKMIQNYLSRPYFDTEKTLGRFRTDQLRSLSRPMSSTQKFGRELTAIKFGNHPWVDYIDSTDIKNLDLKFISEIYDRSFGNPSEMTIMICSDLDKELIRSLVEKHIASCKGSGNCYEKAKVAPFSPAYKGEVVHDKNYPILSAPKVDIQYEFMTKVKDNAQMNVSYQVLDYIMSQRCVSRIREERGGTYYVRFTSEKLPNDGIRLSTISFQTRPEVSEILLKDCQDLIDDICENGPSEIEIENAVKYLVKAHGEKKQRYANNLGTRLGERSALILYGTPFDYDYESVIKKISAADIKKLARKVNNGTRLISTYREQ